MTIRNYSFVRVRHPEFSELMLPTHAWARTSQSSTNARVGSTSAKFPERTRGLEFRKVPKAHAWARVSQSSQNARVRSNFAKFPDRTRGLEFREVSKTHACARISKNSQNARVRSNFAKLPERTPEHQQPAPQTSVRRPHRLPNAVSGKRLMTHTHSFKTYPFL